MKKPLKKNLFKSLLPRRKSERRRVELLGGAAVGAFSLLIVSVFLASSLQRFLISSPQIAAVVSAVLADLANGDRASNGLATLKVNPTLVAVAQAKANDMVAYGYFAHVSPTGVEPWHWFEKMGYEYDYAGENLAVDFSDSGDVERAWMNSPTHRDNILNGNFEEIGIATAQGMYQGRPTTFVVQAFGTPSKGGQAPNVASSVPRNPTETATAAAQASPEPPVQVLGSSAESQQPANPEPAVAAALAAEMPESPPLWAYAVGSPRDTMRYAYYVIGLLTIAALAWTTRFEMRKHHIRHATGAAFLLGLMGILLILADYVLFTTPVLAAV